MAVHQRTLLEVIATDDGNPPLTARTIFMVTVVESDEQRRQPKFEREAFRWGNNDFI